MTPVLRHAVLALLAGVLVILGSNEYFLRTRGASSPEEMTSRYVAAMRQGDAAAVAGLMGDGRVDQAAIRSRIATYRSLPSGTTLTIEATAHSEASYLKGARIGDGSRVIDEIGMQHQGGRFGSRWRLFFPPPGALR
ncbi:MAG TPA: hypothetical protein VFW12_10310 [Candidatus Limnocylindria bacterium]|nr:hypothetical protein [Candidatus Limnocylindria bacterium]